MRKGRVRRLRKIGRRFAICASAVLACVVLRSSGAGAESVEDATRRTRRQTTNLGMIGRSLAQAHGCTSSAVWAVDGYLHVTKAYFMKDATSLQEQFRFAVAAYEKALKQVELRASAAAGLTATTAAAALTNIETFRTSYEGAAALFRDSGEHFLTTLSRIAEAERAVATSRARLTFLGNRLASAECEEFDLAKHVDGMDADLARYQEDAAQLRSALIQVRDHGAAVLEVFYVRHMARLEAEFVRIADAELAGIDKHAREVLLLHRLGSEMYAWAGAANFRRVGASNANRYLEFSRPLRELRAQQQKAQEYRARFAEIAVVNAKGKVPYLTFLDAFLSSVERELQAMEKGGWQRQLDRQKNATRAVKALLSQYAAECAPALDHFEGIAAQVRDLASFAVAEGTYRRVVESCVRAEPSANGGKP